MDRIIAQNHFSEKDSATAMVDVLHAVQYLHDIGLVHRDLKLENLMYASDDPASPDYHTVKLVDFGFAKTLRHVSYMKTQCGSPWLVTRTAIAARACRARLPGCGRTPPLIISRQRLSRTL